MTTPPPSRPETDFDVLVSTGPIAQQPAAGRIRGPIGTRLDYWWAAVMSSPSGRRAWRWGGPIGVTVLAAVLRLWDLAQPHSLVFDETFYVKDSYTLMHLGYEGSWPPNADAGFNAGRIGSYQSTASFVAHPPLAKWIMSIGLQLFGAQSSFGWRISTVVVGILAVALLTAIAYGLFRSTLLATIAGGLMAIDGQAIVMSRVALLDNYVMFFALLGFGAILLDRRQSASRLALWLARRADAGRATDWGPTIWWRPWLIAAGILFGLTAANKWSGLYFLAFFAVYSLVSDALLRRTAGITFWFSSTVLRQGPASFLLTVPTALVAYLVTWTGWFVTAGGYDRRWIETGGRAWTGPLAWVPHAVQNFWHYQVAVYNFNIGEHTPHGYQANPLTWLLMFRPTAMYYQASDLGRNGCRIDHCASTITDIANPLIWYAAVAATIYLVYRLIRYRQWQAGLILTGVAAGYLPWLLYLNRTVFQFYTIAFEPYLILALTAAIGVLLGSRRSPHRRRLSGIRLVVVFLVGAALLSAFFYPLWTGMQMPLWFIRLHYWLPSWI